MLDPTAQAAANTGLTAQLHAMQARQEAELKGLQAYLNDDAPQVQALQAQIAGLRLQLEDGETSQRHERRRRRKASTYSRVSTRSCLLSSNLYRMHYRGALTALETARIESTRKLKSLVLVESPALPESAEYPRRAYTLFSLLMGLTLLYAIGRLIVATIEDHLE